MMPREPVQIVRDALDRAVLALARRPTLRGHPSHETLAAVARVETLAHVLALIENGGSTGYAPFLAESTERVLGERLSHVGWIAGKQA